MLAHSGFPPLDGGRLPQLPQGRIRSTSSATEHHRAPPSAESAKVGSMALLLDLVDTPIWLPIPPIGLTTHLPCSSSNWLQELPLEDHF